MVLSQEAKAQERERIAQLLLDLVKARGTEISQATLLLESGLSRARFEQVFEDEDDVFDAVTELWLRPQIRVMEEVLATDLPPNRKMYEYFARRFVISRQRYHEDPEYFTTICEMGAANFERVRSYIDLGDHYLCELIAEAQADGYFAGLDIDHTMSLINQMVNSYIRPDALIYNGHRLNEEKLAQIVDTIFIGLSAEAGDGAKGVNTLRVAS